ESCGYGVPRYLFLGERPTLTRWAEAKTPEQIEQYRRDVTPAAWMACRQGVSRMTIPNTRQPTAAQTKKIRAWTKPCGETKPFFLSA
ncbi:MAG TPA: hypothetical protein VGM27_15735, partial [Acidobacteriaceae bacterium]